MKALTGLVRQLLIALEVPSESRECCSPTTLQPQFTHGLKNQESGLCCCSEGSGLLKLAIATDVFDSSFLFFVAFAPKKGWHSRSVPGMIQYCRCGLMVSNDSPNRGKWELPSAHSYPSSLALSSLTDITGPSVCCGQCRDKKPLSKQLAGEQHTDRSRCDITSCSRCHDVTSSAQSNTCFSQKSTKLNSTFGSFKSIQ